MRKIVQQPDKLHYPPNSIKSSSETMNLKYSDIPIMANAPILHKLVLHNAGITKLAQFNISVVLYC